VTVDKVASTETLLTLLQQATSSQESLKQQLEQREASLQATRKEKQQLTNQLLPPSCHKQLSMLGALNQQLRTTEQTLTRQNGLLESQLNETISTTNALTDDIVQLKSKLQAVEQQLKSLDRKLETKLGSQWADPKVWKNKWSHFRYLEKANAHKKAQLQKMQLKEETRPQTPSVPSSVAPHRECLETEASPSSNHLAIAPSFSHGQYDFEFILNLLDWQQQFNLADNILRPAAEGFCQRFLTRLDGGKMEDIVRFPSKSTCLQYKKVLVQILQSRLGKEFQTKIKCLIMDGTGQNGAELLGTLVSATNVEQREAFYKFLEMVNIRNKAGATEAAAVQQLFQKHNWSFSTALWFTMDSAATNDVMLGHVKTLKEQDCAELVKRNLAHTIPDLPSDVPKTVKQFFIVDQMGRLLPKDVYPLWDVVHIFKNAERHAMAEGLGGAAIAFFFGGEYKKDVLRIFLGSLARLYVRFPAEIKAVVANFNNGVAPVAIPPEVKHKLKIWTWLCSWVEKYGAALQQGLLMLFNANGGWKTKDRFYLNLLK
jgi:hypothetical protein